MSQGKLRFESGSAGARLLVEQLRDFPNGDHDDGPDALEMATRVASNLLTNESWEIVTPFEVVFT